jgi:hypothetical protein
MYAACRLSRQQQQAKQLNVGFIVESFAPGCMLQSLSCIDSIHAGQLLLQLEATAGAVS